jgi:hypothetical protein
MANSLSYKELFSQILLEEISESQTCSRFEGPADLLVRDGHDCRCSPSLFSFRKYSHKILRSPAPLIMVCDIISRSARLIIDSF